MAVQSEGVAGDQPYELAAREEELGTGPDRVEEEDETTGDCLDVRGLVIQQVVLTSLDGLEVADEVPGDAGESEADGSDDEGVVVAEVRDESESGAEGACGTGNLVEDVHQRIHPSKFLDVATDNISRNDTADQLDHTIGNTADAVYGDDAVGIVVPVVREIIFRVLLPPLGRDEAAAGPRVDDEQDGGENGEDDDGSGEHVFGLESLDERSDQDGAHTLEGLVQTGEQTDSLEGSWSGV